jgi:hypothetical protein
MMRHRELNVFGKICRIYGVRNRPRSYITGKDSEEAVLWRKGPTGRIVVKLPVSLRVRRGGGS